MFDWIALKYAYIFVNTVIVIVLLIALLLLLLVLLCPYDCLLLNTPDTHNIN